MAAVCALGWLQLAVEQRPERLYTPQDSTAMRDKAFVDNFFGYGVRLVDLVVVPERHRGDRHGESRVATGGAAAPAQRDERAHGCAAMGERGGLRLQDVCLQSTAERGCIISSALAMWNNDASLLRETRT